MALADERGASLNGEGGSYGESFERQPPQDVAAEQSVLGGMMLSKDAIADVVEVLRPGDFYRPAHQVIYDCVLDLYGRGEPADAITVSAELERRNELVRVGGAPYLHTLIATVPTAANAGYYAEIVSEKAVLRRLVEAGTRIVQLGYHGSDGADINEVVDRAQASIYEVTERSTSEDYAALEELLQPTMDEIDAIASRGGQSQGIPTGFTDLDAITNGLHPGQMVIVAARPGVGKALALDTPLPTPTGWTTMGAVAVGDELLGADGCPTTVVAATDVLRDRPCYEVEFSDGTLIVADADHRWRLANGQISRTGEVAESVADGTGPVVVEHGALRLPEQNLPLPPYVVGVWLAAGDSSTGSLSTVDGELVAALESEGIRPADERPLFSGEFAETLYELGVWSGHELPDAYLRGSEQQRRALLAGLLDAAGSVADDGRIVLTASELASVRVRELVLSLGYACTALPCWDTSPTDSVTLVFHTGADEVFRLESKNDRHKRTRPQATGQQRAIVAARRVASVPVRCVEVDSRDSLYLASRSMIPTHNSTLGLDFARSASVKHGLGSVVFSLEMGRTEIVMRMLSAEARIRLADMRGGRMTDDDWTRLARRMSEVSEAPLFVDDSPNLTMMEIRAKARRLKQRHDIKLIVVDYMQLMTSGKRVESRQQEVSEFSRHLKLLAKELEVPVIAISQLNRGPEQRTDKKPQLSDLRESGCLTAGTRLLRADTGAEVTFGELMATGERPLVWSLDERMRVVPRPISNVFSSGIKEVFKVRLASGREIEATANHPMLTVDGWVPLGELAESCRVAVPRTIPESLETTAMAEAEIVRLAHLIGDGLSSCGKFIPERVFSLPREQIALFLKHLWATDGSLRWDDVAGQGRLYYPTTSRRLADDLAQLLLRFGVFARIKRVRKAGSRDGYHVVVHGVENQLSFLEETGFHGSRSVTAMAATEKLRAVKASTKLDTVPGEVWDKVRGLLTARSMTHRDFAARMNKLFCGSAPRTGAPCRTRLGRVSAVLEDADLEMLATNEVFWDEIVEITSLGEQPVYDATVPGTHNFIANGIAMHNSLEQDADVVILIHRPDAFERDDPRMGEADLIVAKHRAGPTATVTVAHQLHYSRFVDMAQE